MASGHEYLVGIDLGTTNCAMATVPLARAARSGLVVENTGVMQVTGPGQSRELPLLPSFLYQPGGHELPAESAALPWDSGSPPLVGAFAREQGARVPGRLVSSAKSWLVHDGVDREAAILPWGAPPEVPHISPVDVSQCFLSHLASAWKYGMGRKGSGPRLEDQVVVLTIPASFDDVARGLTMKAAKAAGFKNVTLIEEPQAAFYCWMMETGPNLGLAPGERVVVVDVGGGTTDFTLIEAVEDRGEIGLVRRAVGDHLLLGGDNMDMALAKGVESEWCGAGARLDSMQFQQLIQQCRQAKEQLLGIDGPDSVTVTIQGRGRSIVAGSLKALLTRERVVSAIRDGFFPLVPTDARPDSVSRGGLQEFGLPYVADPAVSRHLSAFLQRHGVDGTGPDAVLFNGGVFQSPLLRDRVVEQIQQWSVGRPLRVLATSSLDLAVARGAAYYAWIRHTGGRRIGGGIARSYYVALQDPKIHEKVDFLCVLPQRAEEGVEVPLHNPVLNLAVGLPVRFQVFSSTARSSDKPGEVYTIPLTNLLPLPSIQTILRGGKRMGVRDVEVTLASRVTELGTLELACVESGGSNRWILEFNVRPLASTTLAEAEAEAAQGAGGSSGWPEEQVQQAVAAVESVFTPEGILLPGELIKTMEAALGASRGDWPLQLCRSMGDKLLALAEHRRKSPAHLARWLNVTGWCLRPGYGDARDGLRMDQFWKALHAPGPGGVMRGGESGIDAWILMRRVAGGLNANLQNALWDRLKVFLMPSKGRSIVKPPAHELNEMWRCAASLERLDSTTRASMGEVLAKPLARGSAAGHVCWCLGRIGGRWPTYGPWNTVVPVVLAETWIDQMLPHMPVQPVDVQSWMLALAQLARRTDQRGIDVSNGHRQSVLTGLKAAGANPELMELVSEVRDIGNDQAGQMMGDTLPLGLKMVSTATT
jgi:molecular chaperone DnaK (HSP70)